MENTVGNGAIKIACIQAKPGEEFNVRSKLEPKLIDSDFL